MTTGEPAVFISKTSGSKKKEQEKRREQQQQGPTREEVFSRVDDILAKLIQDGSTNQVSSSKLWAVLRMQIRMDPRHFGSRIRMFLDLPDPLVRGKDPDPSIIKQK